MIFSKKGTLVSSWPSAQIFADSSGPLRISIETFSAEDITNTDDYYHFTVNTNTATSGGVSGGGNSCSAGPATITA